MSGAAGMAVGTSLLQFPHPCLAKYAGSAANDLTQISATALARLIRKRKASSAEVVEAYIERIKAVNPKLNAIVQLAEEQAMKRARSADDALARGEIWGPLHGVPVTIKDEFETKGIVSTIGTLGLKDHVPKEDATVVKRYKSAGAIILGKTNVPELLWAAETDNYVYGRTNNPYDLKRSPNGSSGGEAAIIAAGGSPLGVGSDAGGSIRQPAHFCGIAGLKPTTGRIPMTGSLMPHCPTLSRFDAAGPMSRYVEDLWLGLKVLSGPDGCDPDALPVPLQNPRRVNVEKLRIAYVTHDARAEPTPEVQKAVRKAAKALARAGAEVEEACPPGFEETADLAVALLADDLQLGLPEALTKYKTKKIHPLLSSALSFWAKLMEKIGENTPERTLERHEQWRRFCSDLAKFFQRYDAFLCPPDLTPAWEHDTSLEWEENPDVNGWEFVVAFNMAGSPAAVVRCATSREGLPIGVQVAGPNWREDIVLAVAQVLEDEFGGWRPPGVVCPGNSALAQRAEVKHRYDAFKTRKYLKRGAWIAFGEKVR